MIWNNAREKHTGIDAAGIFQVIERDVQSFIGNQINDPNLQDYQAERVN